MQEPEVLLDGLAFPEGPRWHDGRLWFSDQHDKRVVAMDADGNAESIVEVSGQPSGLGWLPDGRMLVVSMVDRRVLVWDGATLAEHADISALAPANCNDMVVDASGRAYVGNFGFDMYGGQPFAKTNLVAVDPDGRAWSAADDLAFPNGTVITDGGRTLVVGETMAHRLTAYDIADDGTLANRREWASLKDANVSPDGICLDAEGAIWVACAMTERCVRVAEGGEVLEEVNVGRGTFACALGGDDGRTLFLCTSTTHIPDECLALHTGAIMATRVAVPGAPA